MKKPTTLDGLAISDLLNCASKSDRKVVEPTPKSKNNCKSELSLSETSQTMEVDGETAKKDGYNLAATVRTMQTPSFIVLEKVFSNLLKLYLSRNIDGFKNSFYKHVGGFE